jgi:hypothetical protein
MPEKLKPKALEEVKKEEVSARAETETQKKPA